MTTRELILEMLEEAGEKGISQRKLVIGSGRNENGVKRVLGILVAAGTVREMRVQYPYGESRIFLLRKYANAS